VLAQQQGSAWSYFGYNGLGSIRQMYDPAASIVGATDCQTYTHKSTCLRSGLETRPENTLACLHFACAPRLSGQTITP